MADYRKFMCRIIDIFNNSGIWNRLINSFLSFDVPSIFVNLFSCHTQGECSEVYIHVFTDQQLNILHEKCDHYKITHNNDDTPRVFLKSDIESRIAAYYTQSHLTNYKDIKICCISFTPQAVLTENEENKVTLMNLHIRGMNTMLNKSLFQNCYDYSLIDTETQKRILAKTLPDLHEKVNKQYKQYKQYIKKGMECKTNNWLRYLSDKDNKPEISTITFCTDFQFPKACPMVIHSLQNEERV
jgi:hypothetical protein